MKITRMRSFLIILIILQYVSITTCQANNGAYITLSNQIAHKNQLEVISNNLANINTIGFQEDSVIMQHANLGNSKNNNSFVNAAATYNSANPGPLKQTGRELDVAIAGDGYFSIQTLRGPRYTLNGAFIINRDNILTNSFGNPVLSIDSDLLEIPDQFNSIAIAKNGAIFVDEEEIGTIGVFDFINKNSLLKEGENLLIATEEPIVSEESTIISGMLRSSNVNSPVALSQMVELQRSYGQASNLMGKIHDIEKSSTKLIQPK